MRFKVPMGFNFKQFFVQDEHCAMKVGTDGVLVGAWAEVLNAKKILDIGAGSGLISLILSQRTGDDTLITAVESDANACIDCQENFARSKWSEKLELVHADFTKIDGNFDLIISNPPFFYNDLGADGIARREARQGSTLNYSSLIDFASLHLVPSGRLVFISDTAAKKDILFEMILKRLRVNKICYVITRPGKEAKRILWEAIKMNDDSILSANLLPVESRLLLNDVNGKPTVEYFDMTRNLYLDK